MRTVLFCPSLGLGAKLLGSRQRHGCGRPVPCVGQLQVRVPQDAAHREANAAKFGQRDRVAKDEAAASQDEHRLFFCPGAYGQGLLCFAEVEAAARQDE